MKLYNLFDGGRGLRIAVGITILVFFLPAVSASSMENSSSYYSNAATYRRR